MKNILIAAYAFAAALIGAGFASGQEILSYFVKYGKFGIIGITVTGLLFMLFSFIILTGCISSNARSYDEFLLVIEYPRLKSFIRVLTSVFSFTTYAVMLSACGEITGILSGIQNKYGALAAAVICTIILCFGSERTFSLNGILGICLAVGIPACCIYMLCYREYHVFSPAVSAINSSFIYSGYNLLTSVPLLAVLSRRLRNKSEAFAASVISAGVLFVIMALIFILLSIYSNRIPLGEFPMLTLSYRQSTVFAAIYGAMLIGAIATTMLAAGGSIIEIVPGARRPITLALLSASAYAISGFGFSRLINTAYKLCGIIGFLVCIIICIFTVRSIYYKKIKFKRL